MIGWTHRNDRRPGLSEPCPCGGICSCHLPNPKQHWSLYAVLIFLFVWIITMPFTCVYLDKKYPPAIRYIEVDGRMCEIHYKETGRTSTGASFGHDEAVCKGK